MKLVLGTAQFGMPYGISNKTGQVTDANLNAIVKSFRSNGNNTFDTARAYGGSEKRISRVLVQSDSITSKIPPNLKKDNYEDWFNQNLFCTLRALERSSIETLVYHRSADLLSTASTKFKLIFTPQKFVLMLLTTVSNFIDGREIRDGSNVSTQYRLQHFL